MTQYEFVFWLQGVMRTEGTIFEKAKLVLEKAVDVNGRPPLKEAPMPLRQLPTPNFCLHDISLADVCLHCREVNAEERTFAFSFSPSIKAVYLPREQH